MHNPLSRTRRAPTNAAWNGLLLRPLCGGSTPLLPRVQTVYTVALMCWYGVRRLRGASSEAGYAALSATTLRIKFFALRSWQ
jgi:hypothetical protein